MKKCPFLTIVLLMLIWELVKYFGIVQIQVAAASTRFSTNIPPPKLGAPPKMEGKYSAVSPNEKNVQMQEFKAVLKAASGQNVHITSTQ